MRFERRVLSAILTLAILMLSACNLSPEAREAKFLEKGKKEFEKKNYAVAVLHFKNASEAKPWDAEPHYQLGLSYLAGNGHQIRLGRLQKGHRAESQAHRSAIEAGRTDVPQPR
jgi:Flp pilus assembly protein TadD